MSRIVTVHSFGHAAGRSTVTANLGTLLAQAGYRVGVMDADFYAPSLHLFFGIQDPDLVCTLNSFIWGKCPITDAVNDVSGHLGIHPPGCLLAIPASPAVGEILHILQTPFDLDVLGEAIRYMDENLLLDYLLVDTTSGLTEATMLAVALSDTLIVVLRPDAHDYQGSAVSTEVARKLKIPQLLVVLNAAPESLDLSQAQDELAKSYACPVGAVLPYSEELALQASGGLVALAEPGSLFTRRLQGLVDHLGMPYAGGHRTGSLPRTVI